MTRTEALKRLQKYFGKAAYYRVHPTMSSPERRADAKAQADALREQIAALKAQHAAIYAASGLPAIDEQLSALRKKHERQLSESFYQRFGVGKIEMGLCFIKAQGDTWEECFRKLDDHIAKEREARALLKSAG